MMLHSNEPELVMCVWCVADGILVVALDSWLQVMGLVLMHCAV